MILKMKVEREFDVVFLQVEAEVRYWEDSTIDGVEDKEGSLTPCRDDDCWKPLINVETGEIVNWHKGKTASIHFKVCDSGYYALLDSHKNKIVDRDYYVPDMLCPKENGYGDYIIMDINEGGIINNWKASFDYFIGENED